MSMRLGVLGFALAFVVSGCGRPDAKGSVSLEIATPTLALQRGGSQNVLVWLERTGPEAAVQVSLRNPPPGISADPLEVPAGQTSGTLHLRASDQVTAGDYVATVVATSAGPGDSDSITLHVTDIPAGFPIVVALEQTPLSLEKGRTTEVAFTVDRSGGFTGGFVVQCPPPPAIQFEPVTVAYDATRFTLKVTPDALLPVKKYTLELRLKGERRQDGLGVEFQLVGPPEAPPQLTSVTPDAFATQVAIHLTLKGTGLSGATEVSLGTQDGAYGGSAVLVSASSNEIQADVIARGGKQTPEADPGQLTVKTPAGTATWPLTLSRISIDSARGSDATGTGSVTAPFATLGRAASGCPPCQRLDSNAYPGAYCTLCTLILAPGVHHLGSVTVGRNLILQGTGELYGGNPTVLEGRGEEHFVLLGGALRQVKLSGYKLGLEAQADYHIGPEQVLVYDIYPDIADVWLTGGDYGLSTCEGVTLHTEKMPLRISDNRIAGVKCGRRVGMVGSAAWPVEILRNGDGSAEAGGVVLPSLGAQYLVVNDNRGAGVKVGGSGPIHDSTFQGNSGPGVWVVQGGANLGTADAPGGNTFRDNAINLQVDGSSSTQVSAVGNCWNPPAGADYADTTADGTCGRIRKPFSLDGTTYIDATGKTQGPFTWTAPPGFNYLLTSTGSGTPTLQF